MCFYAIDCFVCVPQIFGLLASKILELTMQSAEDAVNGLIVE